MRLLRSNPSIAVTSALTSGEAPVRSATSFASTWARYGPRAGSTPAPVRTSSTAIFGAAARRRPIRSSTASSYATVPGHVRSSRAGHRSRQAGLGEGSAGRARGAAPGAARSGGVEAVLGHPRLRSGGRRQARGGQLPPRVDGRARRADPRHARSQRGGAGAARVLALLATAPARGAHRHLPRLLV